VANVRLGEEAIGADREAADLLNVLSSGANRVKLLRTNGNIFAENPMARRTIKSIYDGRITLHYDDTRTDDRPYLVKAPSGDRSFADMGSAETYIESESVQIENPDQWRR
jgi:hypothetical protein